MKTVGYQKIFREESVKMKPRYAGFILQRSRVMKCDVRPDLATNKQS